MRGIKKDPGKGKKVLQSIPIPGWLFTLVTVVYCEVLLHLWTMDGFSFGRAPPWCKALRRPHQKITKSVKTPGASGSVPLLSGLAASQYFLGFDGFKFAGSSYFPELSISSWMS